MAAPDRKQSRIHYCPAIPESFSRKMTGPAYVKGMTTAEARSAWYGWLRALDESARPMPRNTSKTSKIR